MPSALWENPTAEDLQVIQLQLGRPARGVIAVVARCTCGKPLAIATEPRLPDGTPFPTLFYLTEPSATASASRLESTGWMRVAEQKLANSAELLDWYHMAHEDYLRRRSELLEVGELVGISAGGMPKRVKCVHALVAHSLASGEGVNPIGDEAIRDMGLSVERCNCAKLE